MLWGVESLISFAASSLDTDEKDGECLSVNLLVEKFVSSVVPNWVLEWTLPTVTPVDSWEGKILSMTLERLDGDERACGVVTLAVPGCVLESMTVDLELCALL